MDIIDLEVLRRRLLPERLELEKAGMVQADRVDLAAPEDQEVLVDQADRLELEVQVEVTRAERAIFVRAPSFLLTLHDLPIRNGECVGVIGFGSNVGLACVTLSLGMKF